MTNVMKRPSLSNAQRSVLLDLVRKPPCFHGEKDPVMNALQKRGYVYYLKNPGYWKATHTGINEAVKLIEIKTTKESN